MFRLLQETSSSSCTWMSATSSVSYMASQLEGTYGQKLWSRCHMTQKGISQSLIALWAIYGTVQLMYLRFLWGFLRQCFLTTQCFRQLSRNTSGNWIQFHILVIKEISHITRTRAHYLCPVQGVQGIASHDFCQKKQILLFFKMQRPYLGPTQPNI